ncbi:replicative DNA helicase [Spirochaetota bacterium]|nr:replicative DNA helicase [Spirochaetota bacterium]
MQTSRDLEEEEVKKSSEGFAEKDTGAIDVGAVVSGEDGAADTSLNDVTPAPSPLEAISIKEAETISPPPEAEISPPVEAETIPPPAEAGTSGRTDGGGEVAVLNELPVARAGVLKSKFPYDVDAEAACIGCMLIRNELANEVFKDVGPEDFYDGRNAILVKAILEYQKERGAAAFDVVVISDWLRKEGLLSRAGGVNYINRLIDAAPATVNLKHYLDIVMRDALLRKIIVLCEQTMVTASGREQPERVLDELQRCAFELLSDRSSDYEGIHPIADKSLDLLEKGISSGGFGVPSRYKELDKIIIGLQPANLIIVGGRTGMGKTAFALSLTLRAALPEINAAGGERLYKERSGEEIAGGDNKQQSSIINAGVAVGYFSLEMSKQDIAFRILASYGQIPLSHFKQETLKNDSWPKILNSVDAMKDIPIFIDDTPGITMNELIAKARRMVQNEGVRLIVVDYLQLIGGHDPRINREQQISGISKQLKNLARELNIPVIALTQLNRAVEQRDDKEPRLSDIRESGAIEQDADIVLLLHRLDLDARANENEEMSSNPAAAINDFGESEHKTKLFIAKNRNGPTGIIDLTFEGPYVRFTDYFA